MPHNIRPPGKAGAATGHTPSAVRQGGGTAGHRPVPLHPVTTTPEPVPDGCSYRYPGADGLGCPLPVAWHLIAVDGTTHEAYALESCGLHRPEMERDAMVAWVHAHTPACAGGQFAPGDNACVPVQAPDAG